MKLNHISLFVNLLREYLVNQRFLKCFSAKVLIEMAAYPWEYDFPDIAAEKAVCTNICQSTGEKIK